MLKKEKKKLLDVTSQKGKVHKKVSPKTLQEEESATSDITNAQRLTRKGVSELSEGQQEVFEVFLRDHEDYLTIEDNRAVLQQRFVEAKALGEQINQIRIKVNNLKAQLKNRRKQMAVQGLTGSQTESEPDAFEEKILGQLEEEKKNYKTTSGRLKGLKTEIEHLQLLHEKSKVKIQRDFENWWTQEGARLQGHSAENTENNRRHGSPLNPMLVRTLPSSDLSSTPVSFTGDKQTDADIQAFIKARHNLLNSTGVAKKEMLRMEENYDQ